MSRGRRGTGRGHVASSARPRKVYLSGTQYNKSSSGANITLTRKKPSVLAHSRGRGRGAPRRHYVRNSLDLRPPAAKKQRSNEGRARAIGERAEDEDAFDDEEGESQDEDYGDGYGDDDEDEDEEEEEEEEEEGGKGESDDRQGARGKGKVVQTGSMGTASSRFVPVCKFFLRGECTKVGYGDDNGEGDTRERCSFRHVKISADAELCPHFLAGFCPLGNNCSMRHEKKRVNKVLDLRLARASKRKR